MEHEAANPIDEVRDLMKNLESLISNKSDEKTVQFNQHLEQLSDTLLSNYHNLNSIIKEYNDRLTLCQQAFVEIPRNPLEKAVCSNEDETFTQFLLTNDPDPYFIPKMQQKSTVLLEFLSKLTPIVNNDPKFLIWAERALLDFDTQDWRIRETAPDVLNHIKNSLSSNNNSNSRMILHIIRSLLLDFNQ